MIIRQLLGYKQLCDLPVCSTAGILVGGVVTVGAVVTGGAIQKKRSRNHNARQQASYMYHTMLLTENFCP